MTISNADILAYEEAADAYHTNADYSIDNDVTKARLFVVAIRRLLRYPTLFEKDGERVQWDKKLLLTQADEAEEMLAFVDATANQVVVAEFCRE